MGEAAEIAVATHSVQLKVPTELGLVVAVNCSYVVETGKALGYGLILLSKLALAVCERASITKCASAALHKVTAEPCLVLDEWQLLWVSQWLRLILLPMLLSWKILAMGD